MVSLARQRFVRLAQVLVPFCTLACFCQTPPQPPPSDTCDAPTTGTVDALEIAATQLTAEGFATGRADDVRPPRALAEGDRLWLVTGGQGSEMVALRLVLRGPDVPGCISQSTTAMW